MVFSFNDRINVLSVELNGSKTSTAKLVLTKQSRGSWKPFLFYHTHGNVREKIQRYNPLQIDEAWTCNGH